jgi:hypothetical protein
VSENLTAVPRELAFVLAIMAFSLVCGGESEVGFGPEHVKGAFYSMEQMTGAVRLWRGVAPFRSV